MNLKRLLMLVCIMVIAEPAMALRCGSRLVNDGDPKIKILKFCGEPTAVQVRTIYRGGHPRGIVRRNGIDVSDQDLLIADRAYAEVIIEEWTYNFGPRKLMRMIKFENGFVVSIRQLGYGYLE